MSFNPNTPRRSFLELASAFLIPPALKGGVTPQSAGPSLTIGPSINAGEFGATGDGITDDTVALQRAIDIALINGAGVALPAGKFRTTGLSLNVAPDNLNARFRLMGQGRRTTKLIKIGTSSAPVLSIASAAIPTEANVDIADLAIDGNGGRADGVKLTGVAHSTLSRVILENCNRALHGSGSLLLTIEDCTLHRSNIGAMFRKNGLAHANAITIRDSRINSNSRYGVDFGEGSMLRLRDCQIEANGTRGNVDSGGIVLRYTIGAEIGYGVVVIDGCWLEANRGRSIHVEKNAGLYLALTQVQILSSEVGRALLVEGAAHVRLEDILAPSTGDIVDITATRLTMSGGIVYQLVGSRGRELIQNVTIGAP